MTNISFSDLVNILYEANKITDSDILNIIASNAENTQD